MTDDLPRPDYDSPWKEVIELFFPQFIAFFFPAMFHEIDWSRPFQFLDQELQQIVRDAELGLRRVDKLVSVYLVDGHETWLLIHIEIQGQPEAEFTERIYIYNYRIYDKYRRPVISLALLTDENRQWRPSHFGYEKFGCRISFDFPVIKLLDYQQRQDELANHENPFAVVVVAHLQTLATRKIPSARYVAKLSLVKALYRRGFSRQEIIELFHFIDWIMILPQEMSEQFKTDLIRFEEEARMPYVTSIERLALQEGHHKGRQEGLRESIIETLQLRFEGATPELLATLEQIQELQVLRDIHKLAVTATSLTAFTERLSEYV